MPPHCRSSKLYQGLLNWYLFFFFNDTATTEIYTLSLHDALPIVPDERERPHLQHHAGEDDRPCRRRLGVGVRQPGVQRPDRHLDGERQREGEEEPSLRGNVHDPGVEHLGVVETLPTRIAQEPAK